MCPKAYHPEQFLETQPRAASDVSPSGGQRDRIGTHQVFQDASVGTLKNQNLVLSRDPRGGTHAGHRVRADWSLGFAVLRTATLLAWNLRSGLESRVPRR